MSKQQDQQSGTVSLKEQLHAIVENELSAFDDADQINDMQQLQLQVDHFMGNLQQQFDSYVSLIEAENRARAAHEQAVDCEATAADESEVMSIEAGEGVSNRDKRDLINLESEFGTYGIKEANGIGEKPRSRGYFVNQTLIGSAVAAAMLWFVWPADAPTEQNGGELQKPAAQVIEPMQAKGSEVKHAPVATAAVTVAEVMEKPHAKPPATVEAVAPVAAVEAVVPLVEGEKITVTAHYGNVRSAPDNSGKKIWRVKKGEQVFKLDERDGWYHVRLPDERLAWIHSSIFAPRLQVQVDLGNVRRYPSAHAKVVTRLKQGAYVTKTGEQQEGWYRVKLDGGQSAWAHHSIF